MEQRIDRQGASGGLPATTGRRAPRVLLNATGPVHFAGVLAAFAALAVFWIWPLAANLSSRIPHDLGDPLLNTWIVWWNAHALPLTERWWNAPVFFPMPGTLALGEHLLGIAVFTSPLQLAGGNAVFAYNIAILLTYALSGFFMYVLIYRLTGSAAAASCAGVAFAFAPYRAGQLAHLQVLTSQWMPAMLVGLHGYFGSGRRRCLALFGAAWLLQSLSNGYYLLFLPILVVLWLVWFTDWRTSSRMALHVVIAWALASLPLIPVLVTYRAVHASMEISRDLGDIRQFSATVGSFLRAPPLLALWPATAERTQEDALFPGFTAVALVLAALCSVLVRRQLRSALTTRSPLLFYLLATMAMWILALGPGGAGESPSVLRPYTWLLWLPGYDALRVPARFAMPGAVCLAAAAGLGVAHLAPAAQRRRAILGVVAVAGLLGDGLMESIPLSAPPPRLVLPGSADAAVIELPADELFVNTAAMYRATVHRQPLVNGYTGHTPHHYAILTLALASGDPTPLIYLARDRPLVIILNARSERGADFRADIEAIPGIEQHGISSVGAVFRLPPQYWNDAAPHTYAALPARLHVARERLVIDLGDPGVVHALEFPLRDRFSQFAPRLLIEASDDGEDWREVWLGWTGGLALEAALQDPRTAPVRIPLPAIRTRYLRVYPATAWMTEELRVTGNP